MTDTLVEPKYECQGNSSKNNSRNKCDNNTKKSTEITEEVKIDKNTKIYDKDSKENKSSTKSIQRKD